MGETFFEALAAFSKKYPSPELRSALNLKALEHAQFVTVKVGLFQGDHALNDEWHPVEGADLLVRVARATGGQGLPADKVDLKPPQKIDDLFSELPPEIQALKVPIKR